VGVPGYEKEPLPELFTVGMHATSIKPGKLGGDFAIGTMPRAFAYGAGVIGLRLGGVLPISLGPDFLLLPSAGGSLLVVGGEGGGGGAGGINAGLATVWWTGDTGVRTGITWHRFPDTRDAIWLVEFGIVRAK
jgi:hypothetical protein